MAGRAVRHAACALLVLIATGTVSARPLQAGPQSNPAAELAATAAAATIEALIAKRTCSGHGKVTEIKCWTDDKGFVTGVSFGDEREKESTVCGCDGDYATRHELGEYESVVEIKACKGSKEEGYSFIEFITDGGREGEGRLTCGSGRGDYDSGKAAKYGTDYKYARGGYKGKDLGRCETITSGKTPKWHQAGNKKWYEEAGYSGEKYAVAGKVYDKAGSFDPTTGQVCSDCKEPPYYKEVHPLAELKGKCNKANQLVHLSSACWNKDYKPLKKVVLEAKLELWEEDYKKSHCPSDARLDELRHWVADNVDHALEEHYIDAKVKTGVYDCKPADYGHNTTVSIIIEIFTKKDANELHKLVHEYLGDYDENLCETHPELGCDYQHVWSFELHEEEHVPKGVKLVTDKGGYDGKEDRDKKYDGDHKGKDKAYDNGKGGDYDGYGGLVYGKLGASLPKKDFNKDYDSKHGYDEGKEDRKRAYTQAAATAV